MAVQNSNIVDITRSQISPHNKWKGEFQLNYLLPSLHHFPILIRNILAVISGHGPFKVHLQKLKLVEETDCPKCGQDSDTSLHYITTCHYYREARKRTFGLTVLKGATEPSCINVSDLV